MPYREEEGALRARRLSLQTEIDSLGHRARELPYLELRKRELQSELAALPDPDATSFTLSRNQRRAIWSTAALIMMLTLGGAVMFVGFRPTVTTLNGQIPANLVPDIASSPPSFSQTSSPIESVAPFMQTPSSVEPLAMSIDFVGSGPSLMTNQVAGIAPLGNWNELSGAVGSSTRLVDSSGTSTSGAKISWTSGDGWFDVQVNSPDRYLFAGYIEQNGAPEVPGTVVVSVSDLPNALVAGKYAVVVYSDKMGNPEDQVTRLEISAGGRQQSFYLRDAALHDYPLSDGSHGYVVATGTRDERMRTPMANCAIFKNVSTPAFEIKVSTTPRTRNNAGGYLRSPINGIQILPMTALGQIAGL